MRAYWVILLAVVGLVALYKVGDTHRKDCINEGRVGCSILPWSGHLAGAVGGGGGSGGGIVRGIGSSVHGVGSGVSGTLGGSGAKVP
jgi:hypothetical protein